MVHQLRAQLAGLSVVPAYCSWAWACTDTVRVHGSTCSGCLSQRQGVCGSLVTGLAGLSYHDFVVAMHLPEQLAQVSGHAGTHTYAGWIT